eukprot:CAMPEP_0168614872 /NCGR_PEP_ID=MMETSP0449_2-20121227/4207_1 /TAXON_ID=1082188 /ORGANISM="Strombidium rassoulzadegani, Strain ras09" /LENGTH=185 /DNA_ID=CAMNT_0008655583 /DNA_START=45 /DNA_END=602 /DNA_ORIENTATION=+
MKRSAVAQRGFSESYLKNYGSSKKERMELFAQFDGFPQTKAKIKEMKDGFEAQNEVYYQEFMQMNENLLYNMTSSGELELWTFDGTNSLSRSFVFPDLLEIRRFFFEFTDLCESWDHHASVVLTHNRIDISLTSHFNDNQISHLDLQIARGINNLYKKHLPRYERLLAERGEELALEEGKNGDQK